MSASTVTAIDLTDLDVVVTANQAGGSGLVTYKDSDGVVIPLDAGASPFPGEVLDDKSSTDGSGTATTNAVVGDGTAGQFNLTIPAGLSIGQHFVTVTITTAAGATRRASGPLTIQYR